jgi:hypothetical protein
MSGQLKLHLRGGRGMGTGEKKSTNRILHLTAEEDHWPGLNISLVNTAEILK